MFLLGTSRGCNAAKAYNIVWIYLLAIEAKSQVLFFKKSRNSTLIFCVAIGISYRCLQSCPLLLLCLFALPLHHKRTVGRLLCTVVPHCILVLFVVVRRDVWRPTEQKDADQKMQASEMSIQMMAKHIVTNTLPTHCRAFGLVRTRTTEKVGRTRVVGHFLRCA